MDIPRLHPSSELAGCVLGRQLVSPKYHLERRQNIHNWEIKANVGFPTLYAFIVKLNMLHNTNIIHFNSLIGRKKQLTPQSASYLVYWVMKREVVDTVDILFSDNWSNPNEMQSIWKCPQSLQMKTGVEPFLQ